VVEIDQHHHAGLRCNAHCLYGRIPPVIARLAS
jgi:hypothetical protein